MFSWALYHCRGNGLDNPPLFHFTAENKLSNQKSISTFWKIQIQKSNEFIAEFTKYNTKLAVPNLDSVMSMNMFNEYVGVA